MNRYQIRNFGQILIALFICCTSLRSQSLHKSASTLETYTSKIIAGVDILAVVPERWIFGCVVPEPNQPKTDFTRIDGFIASSFPPPPTLSAHQPDPLTVSIGRISSIHGPLPPDAYSVNPIFKKLNVTPRRFMVDGFNYTQYGPCIDPITSLWIYSIIISDPSATQVVVVSTSEGLGINSARTQLKFIADSIHPHTK